MMKNLYTTLGVSETASKKDIKKAFRKMAKQTHPDHNPDDKDAKDKFQAISEAYNILSDPEKRQHYDRTGEAMKPKNNIEKNAVAIILHNFIKLVQANRASQEVPYIQMITNVLETELKESKQKVINAEKGLKAIEQLKESFITDDEENLFTDALDGQIGELQNGLDKIKQSEIICNKGLEILGKYTFKGRKRLSDRAMMGSMLSRGFETNTNKHNPFSFNPGA